MSEFITVLEPLKPHSTVWLYTEPGNSEAFSLQHRRAYFGMSKSYTNSVPNLNDEFLFPVIPRSRHLCYDR
ncbi:unnamed protein product [Pieris macdunnoughi]|uniref:Uncharacterized protein n=1 Tax=Pieris macdunnoughi TaxID=345717 RepID=A0A821X5B8_9NEOP|nr:unnamed protein product [Pieris macdunnoughi]